jgi:hypothetical protein
LLGLVAALNACHAATTRHATAPVPPEPGSTDAGQLADGAAPDAAAPQDSGRGATPIWPAAENEILLPYGQGEVSVALVLDPSPRRLDLQLNVDTTGSFGEEIDTLQRELSRSIIPMLRARVQDASFGVSRFADFPRAPFGSPGVPPDADRPYVLLTPITDSLARVTAAVAHLDMPLGHGGDYREAGAEALYQIATGSGYQLGTQTLIEAFDPTRGQDDASLGGVGFRSQALRLVVHVTDAETHTPNDYAAQGISGTHSLEQAIEALNTLRVHAIAIASTSCPSYPCLSPQYAALRDELSRLAIATGAQMTPVKKDLCATGIDGANVPSYEGTCPLVFDVAADGSGLAGTLVDAVLGLLDGVRFDEVHAETGNDPLGFVQRIELAPVAQPVGVATPPTADRLPSERPDGMPDSYLRVEQRNRVGFKVTLRNSRIAPSDVPQRFRLSVRLIGDDTLLEERFLRVNVPAGQPPPAAAGEDAGH